MNPAIAVAVFFLFCAPASDGAAEKIGARLGELGEKKLGEQDRFGQVVDNSSIKGPAAEPVSAAAGLTGARPGDRGLGVKPSQKAADLGIEVPAATIEGEEPAEKQAPGKKKMSWPWAAAVGALAAGAMAFSGGSASLSMDLDRKKKSAAEPGQSPAQD